MDKRKIKQIFHAGGRYLLLLVFGLLLVLAACGKTQPVGAQPETSAVQTQNSPDHVSKKKTSRGTEIRKDGEYTSKEEVAAYLHEFGRLPSNYITKKEAEALGWDSRAGNLWEVAPGKSIGGSRFGNYEGLLPDKNGRKFFECDIDYDGGYRGAKRIIYSNDGLIYYTEDHYESFEQLYDAGGKVG